MKKIIVLMVSAVLLSTLLMGAAPGDGILEDPDGKPWPKEINNGEPSMEKVYFSNRIDLKYGTARDIDIVYSKPDKINHPKYFISNNSVYYWYEWPTEGSRVPEVGLCRWTYLYDSYHEW